MKLNPPLLALAVGAFGIGVTEFAPMGMLPVIAGDLGVSIPIAGLLISAYAIGVMIGAPIMTLAFTRFGKRTALILLMAIFVIFALLTIAAVAATPLALIFGLNGVLTLIVALIAGSWLGFVVGLALDTIRDT